jgi:FkbM family methyltransferase
MATRISDSLHRIGVFLNALRRQSSPLSIALGRLSQAGWQPKTIFDVGVNMGTEGLYNVWPNSHLVLVDPVVENFPYMNQIKSHYPKVDLFLVAAGETCGNIKGNVNRDSGLSIMGKEKTKGGWENRTFPMRTLASLAEEAKAEPPYLIKIDTDARELQVIEGAREVFDKTDVLIVEAKIYNGLKNGQVTPAQIFSAADSAGFAMVDISELHYNQNGALRLLDIVFARRKSTLFEKLYDRSGKRDKAAKRKRQRADALNCNPFVR